jgi:protocatechuate 4,5-dioxygenase beta chain
MFMTWYPNKNDKMAEATARSAADAGGVTGPVYAKAGATA